jgi:hypothetical protein
LDDETYRAAFAGWKRSETDVPLCEYRQDDEGEFHKTTHELNSCLRELFDLGRRRELPQPAVLAKVYHNLSLSSAPPNVDTFNTLIAGLSDIGTKRLVEDCINAFRATQIRTNEISLASILNYYAITNNQEQFQHWVLLMRGEYGGLSTANPNLTITAASRGRLIRVKNKVIQMPSPTPMVFNALIKGVVKFSGLEAALEVCAAMKDEGWGLSMSGLQPILKDCAERKEWEAGLRVWKLILTLKSEAPVRKSMGWKPQHVDLPTFVSMLNLCSQCGQRAAYEHVMGLAVAAHPKYVTQLVRYLKAEREAGGLERSERFAAARSRQSAQDFEYVEALTEDWVNQQPLWVELVEYRMLECKGTTTDTSHRYTQGDGADQNTCGADIVDGAVSDEPKRTTHSEVMAGISPTFEEEFESREGRTVGYTPFSEGGASDELPIEAVALSEAQLHGHLPFTMELEEYENRERPMSIAC